MKTIIFVFLSICLLGCTSTPHVCLNSYSDILGESGEFHKEFLFWPNVETKLKNEVEFVLDNAYCQLMANTIERGQKDWIAIFKDPKIPFNMKGELLTLIHECGIKDNNNWDEMDIFGILKQSMVLGEEDQEGSHESLHEKILAYLEHSYPVSDKETAIQQFSKYLEVPWALHLHTRKGELEFPFILMDYRIPLGIKKRLMYLLHIYGIENR